ncbi:hypothetical protein BH20ACT21_BH20ACT21_12340 [soil metagenome]
MALDEDDAKASRKPTRADVLKMLGLGRESPEARRSLVDGEDILTGANEEGVTVLCGTIPHCNCRLRPAQFRFHGTDRSWHFGCTRHYEQLRREPGLGRETAEKLMPFQGARRIGGTTGSAEADTTATETKG